ncbi:1,4-alpha-glucan-branching enzyme, partial [Trema orientale]
MSGIKGGYWLSRDAAGFAPERIPTSNFTHLFYAYAPVNATNGKLIISKTQEIKNFVAAVQRGHKKAILSIGGPRTATENPTNAISVTANDPIKRASFINSTIDNAVKFGFDGLDLAWEFPDTQADLDNLATLLIEWRNQIDDHQVELLLSATVYFAPELPRGEKSIKYPADCRLPSHGAAEGRGCNIQNFTPISEFRNLYSFVVLIHRIKITITKEKMTNLSCSFSFLQMTRLFVLAMIPRSSSPSLNTNEQESGL